MNTEAIREKFKPWCNTDAASKVRNMFLRGDDKNAHSALYRAGYQQAVKDMDINIQPIFAAINMLERDGTAVRDEISDELRELVDKIKEFQS